MDGTLVKTINDSEYEYTRVIKGQDGKDYTLKKDPVFSLWSVHRGNHRFPGAYTSLRSAEIGISSLSLPRKPVKQVKKAVKCQDKPVPQSKTSSQEG